MFTKYKLKNGLRVVTVPLKHTKTVTVLIMVETGSKYEDKDTNGISHFLEHMFFKGTKKRPSTLDLALDIDRIGGEHNAFTSREFTGYYAKAGSKHYGLILDILSDMYLHSQFQEDEIKKEQGVICEEINMRQDTPMAYVSSLFEKLLYGDQPAGWLTIGTKKNVRSWHREDLITYFKDHYLSTNTIIFVAGNLSSKEALGKVKEYFSNLPHRAAPKKKRVNEKQDRPKLLVLKKKTDQTHFCLGVRGYSANHKDYVTLKVLSAILGGGMSSRLFIAVRVKGGLAYYVESSCEVYTDAGYLVAQAGVPNQKLKQAVEVILEEFNRIKEKAVLEEELQKSKEYLKGRLVLGLETSDELAFWLASQEVLRGKILTLEETLRKINAVEIEDIQRVALDIFKNQKLNLAVIGPQEEERELKEILQF